MKSLNLSMWRNRPSKAVLAVLVPFLFAFTLLLAFHSASYAMPPEPIDPDPIGEEPPEGEYVAPDNGFSWRMASRFGPQKDGMVDFHWTGGYDNRYDPQYVHPTKFTVGFDGCRNWNDEESGTSPMTYEWAFDGQAQAATHNCVLSHEFNVGGDFNGESLHTVTLRVRDTSGNLVLDSQGMGDPFMQNVLLKDLLIVSIGDSYGAGEGAPDVPQQFSFPDTFGQPQSATLARWEDERCHRSAYAPAAQAAQMIELADPHSSVTFLSFNCSGANISRNFYADQSPFSPYRDPGVWGWHKFSGSGILGPYTGAVPPDSDHPGPAMLPSQMEQVDTALRRMDGSKRSVDALVMSGGGNDIGFGNIATLCTLYWDCENYTVQDEGNHEISLRDRVAYDMSVLPSRYAAWAGEIAEKVPLSAKGKVYITEYPDSTKNDQGGYCEKMLDDVVPWSMAAVLSADAVFDVSIPPLPPYQMDAHEVVWASDTVLPALNGAVRTAAQNYNWQLVTGIDDDEGNLFDRHGFCASDNWINTATESMDKQGPWAQWNTIVVPPNTSQTWGTLHPNAQGYREVAKKIVGKMAPNLLPPPPSNPPTPPTFVSSDNQSIVSASGWLTGHSAGTCPGGASDCVFVQEGASVSGSTIRGASALLDGAPLACSSAGTTTNGVTCQGQLATPQTYNWALAFANDGIYSLEVKASAWNDTQSNSIRQVKVDLHNPTVATPEFSDPLPASGWYRTPVTTTLRGADGTGSGVQNIQYQLDGTNHTFSGSSFPVRIDTDGVHTLTYHVTDGAGRSNADQSLAIQLDQTAPESTIAALPAPSAAGWNSGAVQVKLNATDTGGSGLAKYTYRAEGAQNIASTTVNGGQETQLTINAEGSTTITLEAADGAGNTKSKQLVINIDQTKPETKITASPAPNAAGWNTQDVQVTLTPADAAGSGVASYTYSVAGAQTASKTVTGSAPTQLTINQDGTTTITVAATDAVGNIESTKQLVIQLDKTAPMASITPSSVPNAKGWYKKDVVLTLGASDTGGSGLTGYTFKVNNAQPVNGTGEVTLPINQEGTTTITVTATDGAGNTGSKQLVVKLDKTAPVSSITSSPTPDGAGWNKQDVQVTLTPADLGGSGIASYIYSASGAQTIAPKAVYSGTPTQLTISKDGTTTISVYATDVAGNVESPQKRLVVKLDKTAPTITVTTPVAAGYLLNELVTASYSCADSTSGIARCRSEIANGDSLDTASLGIKSFSVVASDMVGNSATQTLSYPVTYGVSPLFDQTRSYKLDTMAPLKLQLSDAKGTNYSTSTLILTPSRLEKLDDTASTVLADDLGSGDPDSTFRYDAALEGYIYNLSTKGLTQGTWKQYFTVVGDPVEHSVSFDVQ